jgi:hypothetical protein
MNDRTEYIRNLEGTLKKFLEPIKGIPFPLVIEALTGCRVLEFDRKKNVHILELLKRASAEAGKLAAKQTIVADRPNEAGNRIEPFVLFAFNNLGFAASKPQTHSGKIKAAGYPDIELRHESGWSGYLDCKTFATKSIGSTFRAFYLSPSKEPKITRDAVHLLLSFELQPKGRNIYIPMSWHLYDLHSLEVQVKHEFNASNRDLYTPKLLLAEDSITV